MKRKFFRTRSSCWIEFMVSRITLMFLFVCVVNLSGCASDEDNPMIDRHRALLAEQEGDYDRAIEIRDQVLEDYPDYPFRWEVTYEQGVAYLERNMPEKALEYFEKTIEIDPYYNFAYIRRAECQELLGNPEAALKDSSRALEVSDISLEFADLFRVRGNAYSQQEDWGNATESWEIALKINPEMLPVMYRLASRYLRTERPERALALLDRSLEINSRDPETNLMKSIALVRLDRLDEAREALRQAHEVNEENRFPLPASVEELQANERRAEKDPASQQSPESSAELRSTAFEIGRQYLEKEGFECSASLDKNPLFLECTQDGMSYKIFVKHVQDSQAGTFQLTEKELDQITNQSPPAGLLIVTGLDPDNRNPSQARVTAFTKSWRPDPSQLAPVTYRYPLP